MRIADIMTISCDFDLEPGPDIIVKPSVKNVIIQSPIADIHYSLKIVWYGMSRGGSRVEKGQGHRKIKGAHTCKIRGELRRREKFFANKISNTPFLGI